MNLKEISITILVKNSQKYLREVLTALQPFGEVVIYDNGSTDATLTIAAQFPNVRVHKGSFLGFGPTHNRATELASNDWIFSVDSDEVVSSECIAILRNLAALPTSVYTFPRHNYYNGKWIRWCGWYPDRVIRLYHRTHTRFSDAQVHESILTQGSTLVDLDAPIKHYSYDTIHDFLTKMQSYSDLFAKQYVGKKKASTWTAVFHGVGAFLKSYLLKKGFLGGKEGFIISAYNGHTAFYKYLKLAEANTRLCPDEKAKSESSSTGCH